MVRGSRLQLRLSLLVHRRNRSRRKCVISTFGVDVRVVGQVDSLDNRLQWTLVFSRAYMATGVGMTTTFVAFAFWLLIALGLSSEATFEWFLRIEHVAIRGIVGRISMVE
jgi:hypothetical protein